MEDKAKVKIKIRLMEWDDATGWQVAEVMEMDSWAKAALTLLPFKARGNAAIDHQENGIDYIDIYMVEEVHTPHEQRALA